MITKKEYIDMIGHASTINANGHLLTQEAKHLSTPSSSPASRMPIGACHEFLVEGNCDFDDFVDAYKYEVKAKYESRKILEDEDLGWEAFSQMNSPVIGQSRIKVGYKYGLIDAISHSFILTDEGWRNDEYEVVLPNDAPIDDVYSMVSSKVQIIPSFTLADFEQAETIGEFYVNERMIASKDQEGSWIDHSTQKKFNEGEIIRLLHHRNDPFVLMGGHSEATLFHGNVSKSNKPQLEFRVRKDSSYQGDCVYSTTSIDEAVKVYGNPRSFEVRGKLDRERTLTGADPSPYKFGHLYELTTSATLYKASIKPKYISYNDLPSHSAFMLLAKHTGLSAGFASNQWQEMKSAACTLDVYKTISTFCSRARLNNVSSNIFKQIFGSLGFEGVEINVPSKDVMNEFKSTVNQLRTTREDEFNERGVKKESVIKLLDDYIHGLEDSFPPKAQNSHVVVFDHNQIESKHLTILPLHKHFVGKEDVFYSSSKSICLEDVLQFGARKQNTSEFEPY